jgi:hypothetical protein
MRINDNLASQMECTEQLVRPTWPNLFLEMLDERPHACANRDDPLCTQPVWLVLAAKTKEAGLQLKSGTAVFDRAHAHVGGLYRALVPVTPSGAFR